MYIIADNKYKTEYRVSVGESYYQKLMLELEGPLSADKEKMINAEKEKYDKAKKKNIPMLYDTGYREILWMNGGKSLLVQELLLASIAIILAFGSTLSMEKEKQSWMLLGTTFTGRNKIQKTKWGICLLCSCLLAVYSWILRWVMINNRYPMRKMLYSTECIFGYDGMGVPLLLLLLFEAVLHILLYAGITAIVLYVSGGGKE